MTFMPLLFGIVGVAVGGGLIGYGLGITDAPFREISTNSLFVILSVGMTIVAGATVWLTEKART
jgi:hypothetical protein